MQAAEEDFEAGGRKFRAGAFIISGADRAALEPTLKDARPVRRGPSPSAPTRQDARPRRAAHRLRARVAAHAGRRLGARRARHLQRALHLLRRHQAARGQPAREVRRHHLPARRRHAAVAGERHPEDRRRAAALQEDRPTRRTSARSTRPTTSAAAWAWKGCSSWRSSCRRAARSSSKGSTATIFPEYGITTGVTVERPTQLFARGSIMRARGPTGRARSPTASRTRSCPSTSTRIRC